MKKIILSIMLCLMTILPVFSQDLDINTEQLNKNGWEYLKKQDYPKAYNAFGLIYENLKTQQDYNYTIYGFLKLINNNNISASLRIRFCDLLFDEKFSSQITDEKSKNIINAITFKMINIVANADENDDIFKNNFNQGKQIELKKFHDIYAQSIEEQKGSFESLLMFACYEYATGNKVLSSKMFEYIKKSAKRKQKKNINEFINLVKELCE